LTSQKTIFNKEVPMSPKKRKSSKKSVKKRPLRRKVVKKFKRKILKKRIVKKRIVVKKAKEKENIIGTVTHYFPKVRAAVIKLKAPLAVGDTVKIKGHTTDFTQTITSIQIDHVPVNQAKKGQEIGLLVDSRARQHDTVYKV
jgi:putative protease